MKHTKAGRLGVQCLGAGGLRFVAKGRASFFFFFWQRFGSTLVWLAPCGFPASSCFQWLLVLCPSNESKKETNKEQKKDIDKERNKDRTKEGNEEKKETKKERNKENLA